ncbi:MAG: CopD family protein [Gemmatimonadetes bacterium]|nr:CopD family protein [Gemmatimonadota bacterium]
MVDGTTIAKALLYVGAIVAVGELALPTTAVTATSRRMLHSAACVALCTAPVLWLFAQLRALEMPFASANALLGSGWGDSWVPFAIGCLLTALALPVARAGVLPFARAILAASVVALAIAMGGMGHPNADEIRPVLARGVDALHVLGMGAWIGALLLAVTDGARGTVDDVRVRWQRMSRVATIAAPVAVLTGVGGAWRLLDGISLGDIARSGYGQLLLAKSLVVAVMLGIGASQRRRVGQGTAPVSRLVRFEVVCAAVVTLLTALLTGSEPPG